MHPHGSVPIIVVKNIGVRVILAGNGRCVCKAVEHRGHHRPGHGILGCKDGRARSDEQLTVDAVVYLIMRPIHLVKVCVIQCGAVVKAVAALDISARHRHIF